MWSKMWIKLVTILIFTFNCIKIIDSNENISNIELCCSKRIDKRYVDPTFHGKPKTQREIWHRNFETEKLAEFDQTVSLVTLLVKVIGKYFTDCVPLILYDQYVLRVENQVLEQLFQKFPTTYLHGSITKNHTIENRKILLPVDSSCRSFIVFIEDPLHTRKLIGPQTTNKVLIVPRSSQWKLQEFLASPLSSDIINLLVIGESYSSDRTKERPYVLYTHQLYTDGLGSNRPVVLTSWVNGRLSRPHVNLFPTKLKRGFSSHRFIVAAANQHPFVFRQRSTNNVGQEEIKWDGIEYRLLTNFGKMLNFTFEIVEPFHLKLGAGDAVVEEIKKSRADIGMSGIYVTRDRTESTDLSVAHSTDCAAFITLTSKALSRYRAIMGPFQWPVWVALTTAYIIAIFPLAYSNKLTLRHLIGNFGEIENMFWYVFGTFTNSLTFTGENSWSNTKKTSTRILIGWYWVFTIIITACYTGSIIAFVTIPVFPETVDSIDQLLSGFYRIGTLDRGGWERWFVNSTHKQTAKLLKNLEFVASVEEGLSNVTKAFFWSYAFLGSKSQLSYIVQSNFSAKEIGKRSALHISDECFSFFGVSFSFPKHSVYKERFNDAILRFQSSGLMEKLIGDVSWSMQRSSTGRLLQASKGTAKRMTQQEERGLTLADTEGMFLLLGIGFVIAGSVLISEWVGGCTNRCREFIKNRRTDDSDIATMSSFNPNSLQTPTCVSSGSLGIEIDSEPNENQPTTSQEQEHHGRRLTHHTRSSSVFDQLIHRNILKELHDGPNRRHSSFVVVDGELLLESDVAHHLNHKYSKNENKHVHIIENEKVGGSGSETLLTVEINRPPTPFIADIEDSFGEKIIHYDDDDPNNY